MKQPYKLKDGSEPPSVTEICDIETNREKQDRLMDWAAKLAKEGKNWRKELKYAGDIGTLVHKLCMDFLSGEELYEVEGDIVANCVNKFLDWWAEEIKDRDTGLVITETPLVSEKYRFGGTPDIFLVLKNKLIDIKTSGGIYESHWIQLAAYGILLEENGYKVDEYQILWLPKDNRFDDPIRTDLRREKRIFKYLLSIYQERKANEPPF